MSFFEDAKTFYTDFLKRGDPRVGEWFLMQSPVPIMILFVSYIFLVLVSPRVMKYVQPLNLKAVLIPYNFILVGLSIYMFLEFLTVSLLSNYSYLCQPVDYSESPLAIRVFFILRKKFNQVSFLHVYHHCTMILNWWMGVKYVAGGQSFFTGMLNSFVHIFMYTYYGLAVFGPHMQKYLWWKKYLTKLQLTQFMAFVIHTGYNLITDCDFPQGFNVAVFIYAITLILLFGNFYYHSYLEKQREKKKFY
ncbi:very long chain fatty acid elongase 4-like isoform X2 [Mytilus galloprovincialis]|uniref:very long chain fatty acid elongase 4-like isoform X2 n=1 Tax=Mytilus galloprovincialis TaxID=29158 RepID=UPI003F7BB413